MKVHVIYAHPVDESFNAAIHRTVVETLIRSGHEVRDLDLYATGFAPAMTARELINHYTPGLNEAPVRDRIEDLPAGLDAGAVRQHLGESGFTPIVDAIFSSSKMHATVLLG